MEKSTKKLMLRVLSLSTALMIFCIVFTGMPSGTNKDLFGFGLSVSAASTADLSGVTMPTLVGGAGIDHPGTITGGTGTITIAPQTGFAFSGNALTPQVIGQGTKGGNTYTSNTVLTSTAEVVNGEIVITLDTTVTEVTKIDGISVTGVKEFSNFALKLTNNGSNVKAALYSDEAMTNPIATEDGVFKPYAIGATVYIKISPAAGYEITGVLQNGSDCIFNYNSVGVIVTKQEDGTYMGSFTTEAGDSESSGALISNIWKATATPYTITKPTIANATVLFKKGGTPTTTANFGDSLTMTITAAEGYCYRYSILTADSFVVTGGTKGTCVYNSVGYDIECALNITNVTGNVKVDLANGFTSSIDLEEYDGMKLPIDGTILIAGEHFTVDQNITWTHKSGTEVDNTIPYGDTVTIPVLAPGYTITGTPTISINGGGIKVTGAYSNGNITFTMPDIGNNGASIDLVEISGLTTSTKSYNIAYNKSAMKVYSNVPAPVNGAVTLTGLPVDTDGTLSMKGDTGYYAEIIPPAGATSYDVTPKLFGGNDPEGNWGFNDNANGKANITEIKDANGKVIGLYFTAAPADMEITISEIGCNSMNIGFNNVVISTPPTSSEKEITSFKIGSNTGTISGTNISVTVPFGTDVKSLIPIIELSKDATVSPKSGIAQDFTKPVDYTVKAQNGDEQTYKVTVIIASQTAPVVTPTPSSSSSPSSISTPAPEPKIGGTTGWTNLEEKILKTETGGTVTIDMNGTTSVPQNILSDIKGKDVTAKLDFGTYSWEINGKDITTAQSVDLGVTYAPNVISSDVVGSVAGNSPFIQLQLNYNGSFGFTGKLTVHLPAEMAGQYANLYYYNPKTKKLELYASALIGKDGKATFNFSHASDYVVVMEKTSKSSNLAAGESVMDSAKPITKSVMPYAVIAFVFAVGMFAFKQKKARK